MSSYVNRKIRVFKEAGDIEVRRKRSDGRLKTYQSATDARAWCDSTEQRRQYILDLVRQGDGGKGLSLGKFIPIEAIIDILLANKNADIKRLLEENEELRRLLKKYGVKSAKKTDADDDQSKAVKYQSTARDDPSGAATAARAKDQQAAKPKPQQKEPPSAAGAKPPPKEPSPSAATRPKTEISGATSKAPSSKITPIAEEPTARPTGSPGRSEHDEKLIGQPIDYSAEDDKTVPQAVGPKDDQSMKASMSRPDGKDAGRAGAADGRDLAKGAGQDLAGTKGADLTGSKGPDLTGTKGADLAGSKGPDLTGAKKADLTGTKGADLTGSKGADLSGSKAGTGQGVTGEGLDRDLAGDDDFGRGLGDDDDFGRSLTGPGMLDQDGTGAEDFDRDGDIGGRMGAPESMISRPYDDRTDLGDSEGPLLASDQEQAAAEFLAMSPGDQVSALKNALAEKDASQRNLALAAIEQLEAIKDIVDDNEDLKRQLDKSQKELETLKASGSPALDSCKDEIEALEREIQRMRASGAEPETEIVKKEMEVLKKYCAQLGAIQRENQELKKERDLLRQGLQSGVDDPNASEGIRDKLMKLEEVTQERDRLRGRVQQLENELKNMGNLPPSGGRSEMLGGGMMDDLQRRLDALRGLEDEVRKLKKKAKTCEDLDRKLLSSASRQSATDSELEKMKKNCEDAEELRKRIKDLERELEMMKCKCKDAELLRVERDCLAKRLEDMDRLRRDYEDLLNRTKDYDAIKCELAKCKAKCEELQRLADECDELRAKVQLCEDMEKERQILMQQIMDCECCINNQQDEIKRLACHINCLTDNLDKRQDQMKVKVCTMRAHLEKKDELITKSEQRLADVQCQLRNSIEGVSCETTCLRNRIEELENELTSKARELVARDAEIEKLNGKVKELLDVQARLEEAREEIRRLQDSGCTGDEHYKKMLKQTKCAVKCMAEKLARYELGDGRDREDLLNKIKLLEGELDSTRKAMEQMKACGETSDRSADSNIVSELRQRIADLEAQLKDALDRARSVNEENSALRKTSVQLQDNVKDTISKLDAENKLLRSESRKLDDVQGAMTDKDRTIADLRRQIQDEIRKREEAEAALRDLELKMKGLLATGDNADMAKLQAEIDRLKNDLDNERKRCQDRIDSLTSKDGDIKKAKSDNLMPKNAEVERLQNELKDIKNANNELLQKISALEDENKKLRDEIARLKQQQAELGAHPPPPPPPSGGEDFSRERDELLRQIEKQKQEIGDLVNKIKQPTAVDDKATLRELDDRNKENSRLKSLIEDLERQLREMKAASSKLPDVPKPAQDLQSLIDELTKKLQEEERKARDALASLTKCMEANSSGDLLRTNEKLKAKIADLEDELARLRKAAEAAGSTSPQKLSADCEEYKKKVKDLESELARQKKDCQEMIANLKGQYDRDMNNANVRNQRSIEKLQKDQDDLVKDLNRRHEKEVDGFQQELKKSETNLRKAAQDERRRSSSIDPAKRKITSKVKVVKKDPGEDSDGPSPPKAQAQARSPSQDRGRPQAQQRPRSPVRKTEEDGPRPASGTERKPEAAYRPASPKRRSADQPRGKSPESRRGESADRAPEPTSPSRTKPSEPTRRSSASKSPEGGRSDTISKPPAVKSEPSNKGPAGPSDPSRAPGGKSDSSRAPTGKSDSSRAPAGKSEPSRAPADRTDPSRASAEKSDPGRAPAGKSDPSSKVPAVKSEPSKGPAGKSEASKAPAVGKSESSKPPAVKSEPSAAPPGKSSQPGRPRGASESYHQPLKTQQSQTHPLGQVKSDSTQKPEPIREASPQFRRESASRSPTRELSVERTRPIKEEKKPLLTMRTFESVCICGKLPIAPSPPPSPRPVSPVRPPCPCSSRSPVVPSVARPVQRQLQQQQPQQPPPQQVQQPVIICGGGHGLDARKSDDKVSSMKKIADLENMLVLKQKKTKEKVDNLQYTVDRVRRELELERQKNQDLINRYANQSQTVSHMIKELDIVKKEKFKDEQKLQQLNSTLKILEKDLDKERSTVKNLIGESDVFGRDDPRGCSTKMDPRVRPQSGTRGCRIIPHFHTEVTRQSEDNRYKSNSVMKNNSPRSGGRSCSCSGGQSSDTSDNFDIDE